MVKHKNSRIRNVFSECAKEYDPTWKFGWLCNLLVPH